MQALPAGGGLLTRLDDFLGPLSRGVWEVVVFKDAVDEPLDAGWAMSAMNVPSPGTVASYRKGRFHAHETRTGWRVHLDRYDPEENPVMHLVDDAPLVLMISDTFMTLVMETRRTDPENIREALDTQRYIWQEQVTAGILLVLAGLLVLRNPVFFFRAVVEWLIPAAIICVSLAVILRAVFSGVPGRFRRTEILRGIGMSGAGILAGILPLSLWISCILAVLALWMAASAVLLLRRVAKGRHAVPEGFYSRMAVALVSLVLVLLLLASPAGILVLLVLVLGTVILLLGMTLAVNGMRLRAWMRQVPGG